MKKLFVALLAVIFLSGISQAKAPEYKESYNFKRGLEAMDSEDYQQAREYFNKELSDNPDNGYAYNWLAMAHMAEGNSSGAITALNKALKNLPKKDKETVGQAYANRAEVYLALADTAKALADFERALALLPDFLSVYGSRGQLYYEMKQYDLSDSDYRRIIELDEGNTTGYMGVGRNAQAQGRHDDAIKQFEYAMRLSPDYSQPYSFRAESYWKQGRYALAADDIIKALELNDRYAMTLISWVEKEQLPIFVSKLRVKAARDNNNAIWPYYLGRMYLQNRKYHDAIKEFRKANEIDANSVFVEYEGRAWLELNNPGRALAAFRRAEPMNPDDHELIGEQAMALEELGRFDEAVRQWERFIESEPENAVAYYALGVSQMILGHNDLAAENFNTASVLDTTFCKSHLRLADLSREAGDEQAAIAGYERALAVAADTTVSNLKAVILARLGRTDEAKTYADSLMLRYPDDIGSYIEAARLYSVLGDGGRAAKLLADHASLGNIPFANIDSEPDYEALRSHPDYIALKSRCYDTGLDDTDTLASAHAAGAVAAGQTSEIPFTKESGVTKVQCTINGLPLYFVFDTGASDVTLSLVEAEFMMKNGYITPKDVIGSEYYTDANGNISEGTVINLRKVDFAGCELTNVRATVVRNQKAPLLLGQSVLGRLGRIEIDNVGKRLIITE